MEVFEENNQYITVSAAALDDLAASIDKMKFYNNMVSKYIEGQERQYKKLKETAVKVPSKLQIKSPLKRGCG